MPTKLLITRSIMAQRKKKNVPFQTATFTINGNARVLSPSLLNTLYSCMNDLETRNQIPNNTTCKSAHVQHLTQRHSKSCRETNLNKLQ